MALTSEETQQWLEYTLIYQGLPIPKAVNVKSGSLTLKGSIVAAYILIILFGKKTLDRTAIMVIMVMCQLNLSRLYHNVYNSELR